MMTRTFINLACSAILVANACGTDTAGGATGDEGQICFANGTCNGALVCLSNFCVNVPGADGGPALDASSTDDSSTLDGSADAVGADAHPNDSGDPVDATTNDGGGHDASMLTLWTEMLLTGNVNASALDQSGHVLMVGSVAPDGFVGKYDALNGAPVWTKRLAGATVRASAVAITAADSVLVAGTTSGGNDFGGGVLPAGAFLVKYDANGQYQWHKSFLAASAGNIVSVMVRSTNEIVLAGYYSGSVDFGGGALATDGRDVVLWAVDGQGNYLRANRFTGPGDQICAAATMDAAGNVSLTGQFEGSVDFGGGSIAGPTPGQSQNDIFIARFDPTGSHIASREVGAAGNNTYPRSIVADSAGNVVVTGEFDQSINFGGGAFNGLGNRDIYLAKLSPMLSHVWSKQFGDANDQFGNSVIVNAAGDVVLAATMAGAVSFGGGALNVPTNRQDAVLARYDSNGNHIASRLLCSGCSFIVISTMLPVSPTDVILGGYFAGSLTFGQGGGSSNALAMFAARQQ